MKKILSIFLAILMVSSVIAILPVFSVSAATVDSLNGEKTAEIVLTKKVIPVDTSSPAIISGHNLGGGTNVGNFFDDISNNSKIEVTIGSTPLTITWKTTEAATAYYYAIFTGNDNQSWGGRNPDGWTLYGSKDEGATYEVLDIVTNPNLYDRNNAPFGYAIDNPAEYQYYKIEIIDAGYLFQANGIVLYTDETVSEMPFTVSSDPLTEGRYEYPTYYVHGAGTGCGFIDGNFYLHDSDYTKSTGTYGNVLDFVALMGTNNAATMFEQTQIFVNGVKASPNKTYLGYTHCGFNGFGGYQIGLVGSGFTKGQESTITLLIGDSYYKTMNFVPEVTTHAVESSYTTYFETEKKLVATVTFENDVTVSVGDKLTMRLHDDHNDREAVVTAVDGKTVTLEVTNFSTSHSLCEFTFADETKFTMPIDVKPITEKAVGYIQTRANADPNKFDTRVLIEAYQGYTANFDSATLEITFTLADGTTRTFNINSTTAYEKVTAGDDVYSATADCALFGAAIVNIPKGTNAVAVKVTFNNSEDNTSETIDVGSASLTVTADASVADIKAMNKVAADKITVTSIDDGKAITDGEGANKLFDGTTAKHGSSRSTFTIEFKTSEAITVAGLIFTVGNDSYGSDRYYTSWKLEGQNADGTWAVVSQSIGNVTKGSANYDAGSIPNPDDLPDSQRQAYLVDNAGNYTNYRFTATGNGNNYNQMGELTLYTK